MQLMENRISGSEQCTSDISRRIHFIEQERDQIRRENFELKERLLEVQSRSMRENLLFEEIENHDNDCCKIL